MEKKNGHGKKIKEHGKKVLDAARKHLMMKISIPVFVLLLIMVVMLWKVPYTARELYTEFENVSIPIQRVVPDLANPKETRVCQTIPANTEILSHSVYGEPFGKAYRCHSEFRVLNKANTDGQWTYRYIFNVSNKIIYSTEITKMIPKTQPVTFEFYSDECLSTDRISGTYQFISGPTTEICEYETTYDNKTITEYVTETHENQRERLIEKSEPLWQKIVGYNRQEKAN